MPEGAVNIRLTHRLSFKLVNGQYHGRNSTLGWPQPFRDTNISDFEPAPAQVPWQIGILFAFKPHRADIWTRHHGASAFPDGLV